MEISLSGESKNIYAYASWDSTVSCHVGQYTRKSFTHVVLFLCKKAKAVREHLGLYKAVKKACVVDRAGEVVLQFLLLMPYQDLPILGMHGSYLL